MKTILLKAIYKNGMRFGDHFVIGHTNNLESAKEFAKEYTNKYLNCDKADFEFGTDVSIKVFTNNTKFTITN